MEDVKKVAAAAATAVAVPVVAAAVVAAAWVVAERAAQAVQGWLAAWKGWAAAGAPATMAAGLATAVWAAGEAAVTVVVVAEAEEVEESLGSVAEQLGKGGPQQKRTTNPGHRGWRRHREGFRRRSRCCASSPGTPCSLCQSSRTPRRTPRSVRSHPHTKWERSLCRLQRCHQNLENICRSAPMRYQQR